MWRCGTTTSIVPFPVHSAHHNPFRDNANDSLLWCPLIGAIAPILFYYLRSESKLSKYSHTSMAVPFRLPTTCPTLGLVFLSPSYSTLACTSQRAQENRRFGYIGRTTAFGPLRFLESTLEVENEMCPWAEIKSSGFNRLSNCLLLRPQRDDSLFPRRSYPRLKGSNLYS